MPYSRTGAGLHRFTDTADGETYLALHGGLDNAQRVASSAFAIRSTGQNTAAEKATATSESSIASFPVRRSSIRW